MDGTMDKIVIEVESDPSNATNGLDNLLKTVKKLKRVSDQLEGMNENGIHRITMLANAVSSLSSSANGEAFSTAISNLRRLTRLDFSNLTGAGVATRNLADMISAASQMDNAPANNAQPGGEPDSSPVNDGDVRESITLFGAFQNAVNGVGSALKKAAGIGWSGFMKLNKGILKAELSLTKFLGKMAVQPFKKLGNSIKGVTGALGTFGKSLLRIAGYRVLRAIISQVSKALQEGVNNLYRYSNAIGGKFAKSMDSAYSSLSYFKNSIGAAVAPIINALAPALDYVIGKVVALINVLNQLFARLSGASTWTKAVKTQKSYADALDKSGGSAKKLKATLMGFDELNLLNDNSSSGGGGGGEDYSSMFEDAKIDDNIKSFADQLREAFNSGDWDTLGQLLGDKVNSIFDGIQWHEVGSKLGYGLNGAIETAYSFVSTVDFKQIGNDLIQSFNGMIEGINFNDLGRLLTDRFTILGDLIYGGLMGLNWKRVGEGIGELLRGVFDEASEWLDGIDWSNFGATLWENIKTSLEAIDPASLGHSFGTFIERGVMSVSNFISGIDWGDVVFTIIDFLSEAIKGVDTVKLIGAFATLFVSVITQLPVVLLGALGGISGMLADLFEEIGWDGAAGLFNGFSEKLKDASKWCKEHIVEPVVKAVKDFFGIHSPSTVFAEIGQNVIAGLYNGISATWSKITGFFSNVLLTLKTQVTNGWNAIKSSTSSVWNSIYSTLSGVFNNIRSIASSVWNSISSTVRGVWNTMMSSASTFLSGLLSKFTNIFNSVKSTVSNAVSNIKNAFNFSWKLPSLKLPHITVSYTAASSTLSKFLGISSIPHLSVSWYANGGFPDMGDLFIANEAGAEMVGSIGGKTAVANNDQIVEAVSEGVRKAILDSTGNGAKETIINLIVSGKKLHQEVVRENRNAIIQTGLNPMMG